VKGEGRGVIMRKSSFKDKAVGEGVVAGVIRFRQVGDKFDEF
jgi:hypothetical protein